MRHVLSIKDPSASNVQDKWRAEEKSIFASCWLNHHVSPYLWYYRACEINSWGWLASVAVFSQKQRRPASPSLTFTGVERNSRYKHHIIVKYKMKIWELFKCKSCCTFNLKWWLMMHNCVQYFTQLSLWINSYVYWFELRVKYRICISVTVYMPITHPGFNHWFCIKALLMELRSALIWFLTFSL